MWELQGLSQGLSLDLFSTRFCRIVHADQGWYLWDGRVFKLVNESSVRFIVMEQLSTVYGRLHGELEEELTRAQLAADKDLIVRLKRKQKMLRNYNYSKDVDSTLKVLAGEMHVDNFVRELNGDPHILNVANGVVDLRTGERDIHRPQYLCTQIIDTSYRVRTRSAAVCIHGIQQGLAHVSGVGVHFRAPDSSVWYFLHLV